MNATTVTFTAEQIAQTISNMSSNYAERKVNANDISTTAERETVATVAHDIVVSYTGTFPYMLNMRQYLTLGLTDAQIAGVLNCAIADYRYTQRKAAVATA